MPLTNRVGGFAVPATEGQAGREESSEDSGCGGIRKALSAPRYLLPTRNHYRDGRLIKTEKQPSVYVDDPLAVQFAKTHAYREHQPVRHPSTSSSQNTNGYQQFLSRKTEITPRSILRKTLPTRALSANPRVARMQTRVRGAVTIDVPEEAEEFDDIRCVYKIMPYPYWAGRFSGLASRTMNANRQERIEDIQSWAWKWLEKWARTDSAKTSLAEARRLWNMQQIQATRRK